MTAKQSAAAAKAAALVLAAGFAKTQQATLGSAAVTMYRRGAVAFAVFVSKLGQVSFQGRDKLGAAAGTGLGELADFVAVAA